MIKQKYIEALTLISPNLQVEFHVHINAYLLVMGVMLFQNITKKNDQLVMYVYRLWNKTKHNYNTTKKNALTMVFVLHKFRHYLSSK